MLYGEPASQVEQEVKQEIIEKLEFLPSGFIFKNRDLVVCEELV